MLISDWSSDVCSTDLESYHPCADIHAFGGLHQRAPEDRSAFGDTIKSVDSGPVLPPSGGQWRCAVRRGRAGSPSLRVHPPARQILAEQRSIGGAGVPDRNPALFTELLLSRALYAQIGRAHV